MNLDMLTVWARQFCTDFGHVPLVLVLLFLGFRRSRMAVGSGRLGSVEPGPPLSRTAAQLQESRELILYGAVCAFLWSALGYADDLRSVAERERLSGS